jgi:phenylacetate-CoA ligase
MPAGVEYLERGELAKLQEERLRKLLDEIWSANAFYAPKFAQSGVKRAEIVAAEDLARLPFTTKHELVADQQDNPPYGRILTYPLARYCRLHQTSGTRGRPLRWLDTAESWNRLLECWDTIYRWLQIGDEDRLFFAFSFGPFLGFWTAFEAAGKRDCLCLSGGGMSSIARLHMLLENRATVVLCTPTYALRLAEVARENGIALGRNSSVRALIVAGEPGGCLPATRRRIEEAWQARVFDHSGSTEAGPMTIECRDNPCGLHLLETEYLAEVIDPATGRTVLAGEAGELVVTTLHRLGSPLVRYRTGDLVRVDPGPCPCGRTFLRFQGGILGRTDDMIHVRGNNLYPSAVEDVIRRFAEVAEFRLEVDQSGTMAALRIQVEPVAAELPSAGDLPERIAETIRAELLFRPEVLLVPPGSLPRFEMKSRRIHKK